MRIVKLNEIEESKISLGRLAKRLVTEDIGAKNVSISWISFPPGVETEKHIRENEEILIPLEGKGYIRTEEGEFEIAPGMIVFLAPGDDHWHITRDCGISQYVVFAPPMSRR